MWLLKPLAVFRLFLHLGHVPNDGGAGFLKILSFASFGVLFGVVGADEGGVETRDAKELS